MAAQIMGEILADDDIAEAIQQFGVKAYKSLTAKAELAGEIDQRDRFQATLDQALIGDVFQAVTRYLVIPPARVWWLSPPPPA